MKAMRLWITAVMFALIGALGFGGADEVFVDNGSSIPTARNSVKIEVSGGNGKRMQILKDTAPTAGAGLELGYDSSGTTGTITVYDHGGSAYKSLHMDASTQKFSIGGTEKMRLNSSGDLQVNQAGIYNTAKGANDFVIYRNDDNPDNTSGRDEVFRINLNVGEEDEVENSVEMWGHTESYWKGSFYAASPGGPPYGFRTSALFYPCRWERKEQIQEWNFGTTGLYDNLRFLDTTTNTETDFDAPGGVLNDAGVFYGNVRMIQSPFYFQEYNDENILQFNLDAFQLQMDGNGKRTTDSVTGQDAVVHNANNRKIPRNLVDRESIAKIVFTASTQAKYFNGQTTVSLGSQPSAAIWAMADGDQVGTPTTSLADVSTAGQLMLSTTPKGAYKIPRAGLTIKQDGKVALGWQVMNKPYGLIGQHYYGLDKPADRLHIHMNTPASDPYPNFDRPDFYDDYAGDDASCVRFTNDTTSWTLTDGLRVGINENEEGIVWQFENKPILFATNNAERVRIGADGKFGIGATPLSMLDVEGGAAIGATYSGTTAAPTNGLIVEGNVGIGKNNPTQKLDVNGHVSVTGNIAVTGTVDGVDISARDHDAVTLTGQNFLSLSNQQITANAVNLGTSNVTGTLPISRGGTNNTSAYTAGSIVFSDGSKLTENNSNLFWDDTNGRLGLGLTAPNYNMQIHNGGTGGVDTILQLTTGDTDSTAGDGLFLGINTDTAYLMNAESGGLVFMTNGDHALKLDATGNVVNGGFFTTAGTSAEEALVMGLGVQPTSSPSDLVQMFVIDSYGTTDSTNLSAELWVRDEDGNITNMSPHNRHLLDTPDSDVELPWTLAQRNPYIGVEQNVDMSAVVREVERLSGKEFVRTRELPGSEIEGWYANQQAEKERVEKLRREEEMKKEIECPREEAIEQYPLTVKAPQTIQTTEYEFDPVSGQAVAVTKSVQVEQEVPTGQMGWRLKAGARLDPKTGKFYRHKTADEVTIEPYQIKDPPAWILERMQKHGRL